MKDNECITQILKFMTFGLDSSILNQTIKPLGLMTSVVDISIAVSAKRNENEESTWLN